MRSRRRTERSRPGHRRSSRVAAALTVGLVVLSLAACTPRSPTASPAPTVRETSIDVAPPADFTAAKDRATAVRDDSLALLAATDRFVEGSARADLLAAVPALNSALAGVSTEALTVAADEATEAERTVAERVLGLGAATLASGAGSNARLAALRDAIEQLEAAVAAGSGFAAPAKALLDARNPLVPPPGSGGAPPPRPTRAPAAPPPPAPEQPAPEQPAPEQPAPEQPEQPAPEQPTTAPIEPGPQPTQPPPAPEPTATRPPVPPVPDCSTDPRLCPPVPVPTIGGPER